jgi:hypothetical protein
MKTKTEKCIFFHFFKNSLDKVSSHPRIADDDESISMNQASTFYQDIRTMITNTRPHENGNAIWFVLVAVALLAALTMAVTRSSDTTEQTGDIERARIQASDLLRYIKGVEAAVDNMLLRGISESDVCFHDSGWGNNDYNGASCANSANRIFDIEGAGLAWRTFNYVTSWDIFGSHLVQDLETSNTDLIMQAQVSGALCRELNTMLGIPIQAAMHRKTTFRVFTALTAVMPPLHRTISSAMTIPSLQASLPDAARMVPTITFIRY